jgi:hypothetical protein
MLALALAPGCVPFVGFGSDGVEQQLQLQELLLNMLSSCGFPLF